MTIDQAPSFGWWEEYHDVHPASCIDYWAREAQAEVIYAFSSSFLPGLLQTEAYMRAFLLPTVIPLSTESSLDERVAARLKRQWYIFERSQPVQYHAVIDEFVLQRAVGGKEVMYEQLQHLRKLLESGTITLHITQWRENSTWHHLYFTGQCLVIDDQLWREDLYVGMIADNNPFVVSSYLGYFRRTMREALDPPTSQRYLEKCIATFE